METNEFFEVLAMATKPLGDGRQPKMVFFKTADGRRYVSLGAMTSTTEKHVPILWDPLMGNEVGFAMACMRDARKVLESAG